MSRRLMVRMVTPVAAISVLLLLVGSTAAWYVYRLQKEAADVLAVNVASVRGAADLEIGLLELRGLLKNYHYTGDRRHLDMVAAVRRRTDHALREVERGATTSHEQVLVAEIKRSYERLFHRLSSLAEPGGPADPSPEEVRGLIANELQAEILRPTHAYLEYNEQAAARSTERNQAVTRLMVYALLLLGACGGVAGLVAGYGIARGIARSIGELSRPIEDAAGRLTEVTGPVPISSGRELPDLEANLQRVARQASAVVQRLHESQRETLRAEQLAALGQLAAGLAHELRNPLMSMKVLVQPAAVRGSSVHLSERDLEVLDEEITRLERLIQTFLDFARPPQPEKRPFEVQDALAQAVALVSGRAERQGVRVERAGPEEPVVVEADVYQFRQVVLNLLLNALDATAEGGTVTVRVWREPGSPDGGCAPGVCPDGGPGDWLALEVADTGRGLPADLGGRIFEPFVSTKETGLGLGLSICRRIVEAHGGELTAADRPERGAAFTARLPLRAAGPRPARQPPVGSTEETDHADPAHRR